MPADGTRALYRNVPEAQEELIALLTDRYAARGIRFDTGFVGSVPVQCSGRVGRRYFYFRFRHDSASLTIGSADHRRDASHAKHARRKALRKLRRGVSDDWFGFMARNDLKRDTRLERHPSNAVWYATVNDVTGEPYAGDLEPEECAEIFAQLMDRLTPVPPSPAAKIFRAWNSRSYTPPMDHAPGVIRKASKARR